MPYHRRRNSVAPTDADPCQAPTAAPAPNKSRPASKAVTAATVAALLTGAWLLYDGSQTSQPPAPNSADALSSTPSANAAKPSSSPVVPPLTHSVPDRIAIPALNVNAPLTQLGLDQSGSLQPPPPTDRNLAGWYK